MLNMCDRVCSYVFRILGWVRLCAYVWVVGKCAFVCAFMCVCLGVWVDVNLCMSSWVYLRRYVGICACVYAFMLVCLRGFRCVRIYACMFVCVCLHMCVKVWIDGCGCHFYTHIHTLWVHKFQITFISNQLLLITR